MANEQLLSRVVSKSIRCRLTSRMFPLHATIRH